MLDNDSLVISPAEDCLKSFLVQKTTPSATPISGMLSNESSSRHYTSPVSPTSPIRCSDLFHCRTLLFTDKRIRSPATVSRHRPRRETPSPQKRHRRSEEFSKFTSKKLKISNTNTQLQRHRSEVNILI